MYLGKNNHTTEERKEEREKKGGQQSKSKTTLRQSKPRMVANHKVDSLFDGMRIGSTKQRGKGED